MAKSIFSFCDNFKLVQLFLPRLRIQFLIISNCINNILAFISKGNFCSALRGGLRHFMERRKVLRREVLATTCGSLLPKYPFTDVILQTRSCGSPRKYYLDILQYKNQPSSKMRLCPNHTLSLSIVSTGTQVGPEILQKVCENIFKLLSKDTPPLETQSRDTSPPLRDF